MVSGNDPESGWSGRGTSLGKGWCMGQRLFKVVLGIKWGIVSIEDTGCGGH